MAKSPAFGGKLDEKATETSPAAQAAAAAGAAASNAASEKETAAMATTKEKTKTRPPPVPVAPAGQTCEAFLETADQLEYSGERRDFEKSPIRVHKNADDVDIGRSDEAWREVQGTLGGEEQAPALRLPGSRNRGSGWEGNR
eukprot:evm.model.NODE_33424_length_10147_cov_30.896521.1